jgi:hypothetical protein
VLSNSLIKEERLHRKVRQHQTSVGTLSVMSPESKLLHKNKPDPLSFVISVPVLNVPNESFIKQHKKFVATQINQNLLKLQQLAKEPSSRVVDASVKTGALIQKTNALLNQRKEFYGRGLKENRKTFYLMDYINNLKIEESAIKTRDYELALEYIVEMQKLLQNPPDFSNSHVVVDLKGYIESIPNRTQQIAALTKKINFLEKWIADFVETPQFTPQPEDFDELLIYPTSWTYTMLKEIEKKAKKEKNVRAFQRVEARD